MEPITTLCPDCKKTAFPSGICFWRLDERTCRIELNKKAIGHPNAPLNMQDDAAAFEAWALFLRVHAQYENVQLGLQDGVTLPSWPEKQPFLRGCKENKDQEAYGHYNRFLYRVMKFREQYPWFKVADADLDAAVRRFKTGFHKYSFCNNVPTKPAKSPENWEGRVEKTFAEDFTASQYLKRQTAVQGVDVGKIYRQLPVGLFQDKKSRAKQIFTANHSAIDLWGISEDKTKIAVYELKTRNKMLGIITELMFYANYMRDMFIERANRCEPLPVPEKNGKMLGDNELRGYDVLMCASEKLSGIYAFMLTDGTDGLDDRVTSEILDEMNQNSAGIVYDAIRYYWKEKGEEADILNVRKNFT